MNTRFSSLKVFLLTLIPGLLLLVSTYAVAQSRLLSAPDRRAVVVDERLSVLRDSPSNSGKLIRRVGRGRLVTILGQQRNREGIIFYRVAVSRRTRGWIQRDALVSPGRRGDDERLLRLIRGSADFDLIARARIFLDTFSSSPFCPVVLQLLGKAAEDAAVKLSRDASRRLKPEEMTAGGASISSYFLNYSGLDRYNRQGVRFVFARTENRFYYDGAAWRQILRRHPQSKEAVEARQRLETLSKLINLQNGSP